MMKRRYFVAIPVLVAAAFFGARHWPHEGAPVPPAAVAGRTAVEQAAAREAASRLARMAPAPALHASRVGKFSAETIHAAEDVFRHMVSFRGLITQEKERRALSQQILATPDGRDLMREILLDPAFANEAFGAFQAEARFYAITVLDEAARQGNLDLAVDTATALSGQLAAVAGEPDKGRSEDLVSLAEVISRNVGSQRLLDADSAVLAKLGFAPEMPLSVRSLYIHGFFQGVWRAEGVESAQAAAKRLAAL